MNYQDLHRQKSKELLEKYPHLFSLINKPYIRYGWLNLIDELSKEITELYPYVVYIQVKEKFGLLRVYCSTYPDGLREILHKYEIRSGTICETCGELGERFTSDTGWINTCCEIHR